MNTLILQRCIKLINSDSKDLHCFQKITISHKSFKTFYSAKNPKKNYHGFYGFLRKSVSVFFQIIYRPQTFEW